MSVYWLKMGTGKRIRTFYRLSVLATFECISSRPAVVPPLTSLYMRLLLSNFAKRLNGEPGRCYRP